MTPWLRQIIIRIDDGSGTAREIKGLDVGVKVSASTSSTPQTAKVTLYNPSPATIDACRAGATVDIFVGYEAPVLLFRGARVPDGVKVERKPPDRQLSIDLADGGDTYRASTVAQSFLKPVSLDMILSDGLRQLGMGTAIRAPNGHRQLPTFYFSGAARDWITRLSNLAGMDLFFRDGDLIGTITGETTPGQGLLISAAAGNLVGSPTLKEEGAIEVTALLAPILRPGASVRVESAEVTGNYRADSVEVDATTDGVPFYMKLLLSPA